MKKRKKNERNKGEKNELAGGRIKNPRVGKRDQTKRRKKELSGGRKELTKGRRKGK